MTAVEIRTKIADGKFQGEYTYFARLCDSIPIRIIDARVYKNRLQVRGLNSGMWYDVEPSAKIYNA